MQPEQQVGQAMAACQKAWNLAKMRLLQRQPRPELSQNANQLLRRLDDERMLEVANQLLQVAENLSEIAPQKTG